MAQIVCSLESLSSFLEEASRRYRSDTENQSLSSDSASLGEPQDDHDIGFPEPLPELDAAWDTAMQAFQEGQIITGIVTGWNRGGLLARWGQLQGFIPASQLKKVPVFEGEYSRDETLARWVGEELDLKIIELDKSRNRLVFSERASLWGQQDVEELVKEIEPAQVRRGYVSNLCDFGAFIDLGGVDGLIHISELSWGRVSHPREFLHIGQEIQVHVLSVDRDNHRVALSLKRLQPNPWASVEERYQIGQIVGAKITSIVGFGAFAQIEEGMEGLIHISEISETRVTNLGELLTVGDNVQVRILHIDSAHHRLGLSTRQISGKPSDPPEESTWEAGQAFLY
jgi:small subunit ribosomal protein S1